MLTTVIEIQLQQHVTIIAHKPLPPHQWEQGSAQRMQAHLLCDSWEKRQAYIRLTPGPQSSQQFKRTGCSHSQSTWMLVKVQARTFIVEKKMFLEESEFSPGLWFNMISKCTLFAEQTRYSGSSLKSSCPHTIRMCVYPGHTHLMSIFG